MKPNGGRPMLISSSRCRVAREWAVLALAAGSGLALIWLCVGGKGTPWSCSLLLFLVWRCWTR